MVVKPMIMYVDLNVNGPRMVELWASTSLEPNLPKTQIFKLVALHKAKPF
jgi:hypothetical protein